MVKTDKKPKLADIFGTKKLRFAVLKGEMHTLNDEEMPKLLVKCIDESDEEMYGKQVSYGFVSPQAVESIENNVSFDKDETVIIDLPYPMKTGSNDINWIKNPF